MDGALPGVLTGDDVQVTRRERVHEGPLLRIDDESVRLPNGRLARLESIRHPGAAAALPFLDEERVLLVRQYRHAVGGRILEVPAGKLDAGEGPESCALREVQEEVGHAPGRLLPLGAILTTPGFTDEVIWLYEAHELRPTGLGHEAHEVIEVVEMGFGAAVDAVREGRITDAKSVATLLQAALRRG